MFADAVEKITESIFPILFMQEQGDDCVVGVCGTGFFVNDAGVFVTADHFMTPTPPGCTHYYYGKVPDEVCNPALAIERLASDPRRDLFVGRVSGRASMSVEFSTATVRPGTSVCMAGYPMALVTTNPDGTGLTGTIRRYWQPTFAIDATQTVIGDRTYDGFIMQHGCLPGMSGGPVFDVRGNVVGMGVATLTRTIPALDASPTVVVNGIATDVQHILALVESVASKATFDISR